MAKLGLDSILTDRIKTAGSILGSYLVPVFADKKSKPELTSLDSLNAGEIETLTSAGAISTTKPNTELELVGAGAVTLDVCPAAMVGRIKTIRMSADNGNVTLALTNIQGQSSGTTATFNDVSDELVLVGSAGGKWTVIKEFGISLA